MEIVIPADVPESMREKFRAHYELITHHTGRLLLMAADQKVEHLNDDFFGPGIAVDDKNPQHLFEIGSQAPIGAFASQKGLIARFGADYQSIPYIIKMNSKTGLQPGDAVSRELWTIDDLAVLAQNGLKIVGVGYTIYIGSQYESLMLQEAAELAGAAHEKGLLATIWCYPRGEKVPNEKDPHVIAGAAGVAASLGADFVKLNLPEADNPFESLKEAVAAAGNTKVVVSGGTKKTARQLLEIAYNLVNVSGAAGMAVGRNLHMRPLPDALKLCQALAAIIYDNAGIHEALAITRS